MKEEFVTYDLAVKLKEKGFREYVRGHYKSKCHLSVCSEPINCNGSVSGDISAPQIHEVLKWLRKEKNLSVEPYSCACGWRVTICKTGNVLEGYVSGGTCVKDEVKGNNEGGAFDWFEQAAIAGIEYALNNLI